MAAVLASPLAHGLVWEGRSTLLVPGGPRQAAPAEGTEREPPLPEVRAVCGRCCPSFGLWERAVGQQPGVPWPGWGCLSPRRCPQLPRPPVCALRGAAADRSSVSLVTAGSRYSGKEAGSARKGRQVWGETALAGPGLPQPLPPCLNCLGSPSRGSARCPGAQMAGMPGPAAGTGAGTEGLRCRARGNPTSTAG